MIDKKVKLADKMLNSIAQLVHSKTQHGNVTVKVETQKHCTAVGTY